MPGTYSIFIETKEIKMRTLAVIASLLISFQAFADRIDLGQASEYNAFIKGSYKVTSSDVQGRVAVGGNLVVNGGYEVGNAIVDFAMNDGPSLVVGGNIIKKKQGSFNIYKTATLPNPVMGDVVLGGEIKGNMSSVAFDNKTENSTSLPVDFTSAFEHLRGLSKELANRTTTHQVIQGDNINPNNLYFSVDQNAEIPADGVYVFNVTEQMIKRQNGGSRSDWVVDTANMADGATVLFNLTNESGSTFTLNQANFFLNDTSNPLSGYSHEKNGTNAPIQVLYNFYGASQLNLNSDLYGSILAPTANIKANSSVIYGQVVGKSWEGNMQINYNPFEPVGNVTPVPEPSTFIIFALAFVLMISRNKLSLLIAKVKVRQESCLA
jgi:choice-of-anchor A domain-containing protein